MQYGYLSMENFNGRRNCAIFNRRTCNSHGIYHAFDIKSKEKGEYRMKPAVVSVQKIAGILDILLLIALACNLIILYLVPVAILSDSPDLLANVFDYLHGLIFPDPDDILLAGIAASFLSWLWVWNDIYQLVLALFLIFSGICTAIILWQARQVLKTIQMNSPFSMKNAMSLHRAAICCFSISIAALIRVIFSIVYFASTRPLSSYNALFVPIFAMAGLLCLVMSALFRQAAELQAESDLTI